MSILSRLGLRTRPPASRPPSTLGDLLERLATDAPLRVRFVGDPAGVLRDAGIDPASLGVPDGPIPDETVPLFLRRAATLSAQPVLYPPPITRPAEEPAPHPGLRRPPVSRPARDGQLAPAPVPVYGPPPAPAPIYRPPPAPVDDARPPSRPPPLDEPPPPSPPVVRPPSPPAPVYGPPPGPGRLRGGMFRK